MLIFFVFVKLLSLMTNTRVGLAHTPKWPNCGSGYACSHQRPDKRVRNFYRKYAGSRGKRRELTLNIEALTRDVVPKVSALFGKSIIRTTLRQKRRYHDG